MEFGDHLAWRISRGEIRVSFDRSRSPEQLACPRCGGVVPIAQRRAGERFSCPACFVTVTRVDSPKGPVLTCAVGDARRPAQMRKAQETLAERPFTVEKARQPATGVSTVRPISPSRPVATPGFLGNAPTQSTTGASSARSTLPTATPSSVSAPVVMAMNSSAAPMNRGANVPRSPVRMTPAQISPRRVWPLLAVGMVVALCLVVGALALIPPGVVSVVDRGREYLAGEKSRTQETGLTKTSENNDSASTTQTTSGGPSTDSTGTTSTPMPATTPPTKATPKVPAPNSETASTGTEPNRSQVRDASEIVKQCESSVCLLITPLGSLGTGFLVAPGLIATNEHVVGLADPAGLKIEFPSRPGSRFKSVELAYAVPGVDLLLIRVPDLPADFTPLTVAKTNSLRKGERLLVIGNPGGLRNVVTQGLFGSMQVIDRTEYVQLSLSVNPGNSGGPALTNQGHVAGVVTLKSHQEGIGLAIPGDVLTEAMHSLQSRSGEAIEKNVSRWRGRQTGTKLVAGCRLSAELITVFQQARKQAQDAGEDSTLAMRLASTREAERLGKLERLAQDIPVSMNWGRGSPLTSEEKQLLSRLESCFRVLSLCARKPQESLAAMEDEVDMARGQLSTLEQQLKSALGLMSLEPETTLTTGR